MSDTNRAAAQGELLLLLKDFDPSGYHHDFYKDYVTGMNNDEFDTFMKNIRDGKDTLTCFIPNYDNKVKISTKNNIKLGEKLNYQFFQRLWITDPVTGEQTLTTSKHLVYIANICRQTQTLDHKISTAKDNNSVDASTGQVRGDSKASQFSGPEFMILKSQGLDNTITELTKFRGGDLLSNRMMNRAIINQGAVRQSAIPGADQRRPTVVKTLSIILNAMLFSNNFTG